MCSFARSLHANLCLRPPNDSEAKLRGPVGGRLSGTTLAATNDLSAGSVCKRRDARDAGEEKGASAPSERTARRQLQLQVRPPIACVCASPRAARVCIFPTTVQRDVSRCASR